jgi:hypothetical protein
MDTAAASNSSRLKLRYLPRKPYILLVLGSLAFLYFHLFTPPFTPIWTGGDAMIWLDDARRMLDGEVLYRDFVQITLPATDLLYFTAFKIFGPRIWIPNVMLVVVGVGLASLSYRVATSVGLGRAALLPPLLFLTLVYRDRLDATHHWYSTLAIMAALAVAIDRRSCRRIAISGALCGFAACFTQSAGLLALVALAVFLYWEHARTSTKRSSLINMEALLVASFLMPILIVSSYFAWQAGLPRFFYCTVVFNLRYYGSFAGASTWHGYMTGLPPFLHWRRIWGLLGFLLVHALLPLVYILFLVRYQRRARQPSGQDWNRLMLVNLVGLASLLSVAAAPTWARLYYVCLPALILFVWLLKFSGRTGQSLAKGFCVFTVILLGALPIAKQLHWRAYLDLPSGRTAFLDRDAYDRYRWAASETRPSDYFFGGFFPEFYFLLDLRNPGPVPFVTPYEYTRPAEVQGVLDGLEKHRVKIVLWTSALDLPEDPSGDPLVPLRAYIRNHYRVAENFPDFEVWVRKD